MRTSETIADLAAALAKAQGAFENPAKDREVTVSTKTGGTYKFKYATFTAIIDAVRKPLADNGLSFAQVTGVDAHGHIITTRLLHASGQWMEFDTPVFVSADGAQAFGSGVTYAKRYALSSLLGITADEDDDGNASDGNAVRFAPPPRPQNKPTLPPPPASSNGAMPNGANDEAAETFTSQSIEQLGKMKHVEAVEAWVRKSARHLEKLKAKYPDLHERLMVAVEEQRGSLPHVTEAA